MSPDIILLLYSLAIGVIAGLLGGALAGLAGVGGGLLYVPLFYLLMPGDDADIALAIFTSMVTIMLTALFSTKAHWQRQHIDFHSLPHLLPGLATGATLGLWSTIQINEQWILLGLALLNSWVAYDYGKKPRQTEHKQRTLHIFSIPIGYLSGLFGIGGGTMLVPLLRRTMALYHAVGTSAFCGLVMTTTAVSLNLILDSHWQQTVQQTYHILIPIWVGTLLTLPFATTWASGLHQKLSEQQRCLLLKIIFTLFAIGLMIAGTMTA